MLHLGGPHMSRVVHALVSTAIVLAVSSTIAWAQAPKAGVVTTLEGTVTATHLGVRDDRRERPQDQHGDEEPSRDHLCPPRIPVTI